MASPQHSWPGAPVGVLRATGEDAFSFLQSQASADLRPALTEGAIIYTLWLDRKGKILADSLVRARDEEDLTLVTPHAPVDTLQTLLEKNLVADDVELNDETAAWNATWSWPAAALTSSPPEGAARWPVAHADAVLTLTPGADTSSVLDEAAAAAWFGHRVTTGWLAVPDEAGPADLPHDVGLAPAVSVTKGCYLGQEVMARLHAMGTPSRGLFRLEGPASTACEAGVSLFFGDTEVGTVRLVDPQAKSLRALAVLRLRRLPSPPVKLSLQPGGEAVLTAVPVRDE